MPTVRPSEDLVRRASSILPPPPAPHLTSVKYADQFLKLYTDHLEVQRFFFPSESSKYIALSSIERVYNQKALHLTWWGIKEWGMSLTSMIWWAQDETRDAAHTDDNTPKYKPIVLKLKGSHVLNGFSVEDFEEVMAFLREYASQAEFFLE